MVEFCRLRVDYGFCISCAACTAVCHTLALNMDSLMLQIDEELCDNCSLCLHVCPTGALHFKGDGKASHA